jgi:hypothetical protein
MKGPPWLSFVIQLTVCVMVSGAAAAVTPVVKSTCMISWDPSEDDTRITEYRITIWMVNGSDDAGLLQRDRSEQARQLAGDGSGVP